MIENLEVELWATQNNAKVNFLNMQGMITSKDLKSKFVSLKKSKFLSLEGAE